MVLMPYLRGITRAHFPFGVALIVLINVIVFFGFQSQDEAQLDKAIGHYVNGPLPGIEFPLYEKYLLATKEPQQSDFIEQLVADDEASHALALMEQDKDFMRKLHAGEIVTAQHPEHDTWLRTRNAFEAERDRIFTNRYHFDTERPSWLTAFTHQFLHGDVGHIFGNMLVLILIAPAVEALTGTGLFLAIYLCSGLAALGMHVLLNPGPGGLVGASGAIAGAMGAFAVLLGRRRIPFFYSLVVYFDVVRAPALLALPIWIANELVQLFWLGDGHVAYGAHFGGLLVGALLAWPWRKRAHRRMEEVTSQVEAEDRKESNAVSPDLARARQFMTTMDYANARKAYAKVAEHAGNDLEVLQECLNVTSLAPASVEYHLTVARVLRLTGNLSATQSLVLETFRDYLQKAQPMPRMRTSTLVGLIERFVRNRNLPELERCVRLLHATAPGDPRSQEAVREAAQCLSECGQGVRAAELLRLFETTKTVVNPRD